MTKSDQERDELRAQLLTTNENSRKLVEENERLREEITQLQDTPGGKRLYRQMHEIVRLREENERLNLIISGKTFDDESSPLAEKLFNTERELTALREAADGLAGVLEAIYKRIDQHITKYPFDDGEELISIGQVRVAAYSANANYRAKFGQGRKGEE